MAIDQITTGIIKDDAVTAAKIPAGAVVADIATGAITTAKLAADAVDGTKLADDAINSEHLTDGSIDTAHLGNLQVTAAKVAADVATTAGAQTLTNKTLTAPTLTTPALGTPASGVATNLTSIPAAAVGGVLPVGVTGGSGLTALGTVTQGTIGPAVVGMFTHITTINLNANPYTGSAGGTANQGGDLYISNLHSYSYLELYFDECTTSADAEWRMKICYGTNSSSSVVGNLSHTLPSGISIATDNWYVGTRSGPDQDNGYHTSNYTNQNHWKFMPSKDLNALGDAIMRINLTVKKHSSTTQKRIYGYMNGQHAHTTTAMGPYESSGIALGNYTTFNGFLIQPNAGNWDSGKIRIYGRRAD